MSAVDALWLAGYIAAGDEAGQREVVATGAVPELVRHLGSRERQRVIPALRATGNLALGDDSMVSGSPPRLDHVFHVFLVTQTTANDMK